MTPDLVGLAKRLEGKPFHLIASHCQNNSKDDVVAFLKESGLAADSPNFTLTSFGGHPKVKGTGYVPYYMVFDHKGDLFHHHMAGQWHGGDKKRSLELVDELLTQIVPIDVGEEPFQHFKSEAREISRAKKLGSHVKKLEKKLEKGVDGEAKAEIDRLLQAVASYRDKEIEEAKALAPSEPGLAMAGLDELAKQLKKTQLGEAAAAARDALAADPAYIAAADVEAKFTKALKGLKACKGCKREHGKKAPFRAACPGCAKTNKRKLAKAKEQLLKLSGEQPDAPISKRIREYAESLP